MAKFDKDLNQIWYRTWGGGNTESARAITIVEDGSIYVGGSTNSFGQGGTDVLLFKYDPNGDLAWYRTWGDSLDDQTLDIYLSKDDLYLTGKSQSYHPTQKWEAILLKIPLVTSTAVNNLADVVDPDLNFFPNPMTHSAVLKVPADSKSPQKLILFDVMGREVKELAIFSVIKSGLKETI